MLFLTLQEQAPFSKPLNNLQAQTDPQTDKMRASMQRSLKKDDRRAETPVIILVIGLLRQDDCYISELIDFVQHTSETELIFIYCKNFNEVRQLSILENVNVILLDLTEQEKSSQCLISSVNQLIPDQPIIAFTTLDADLMHLNLQHESVQDYLAIEHLDSNFLKHSIHYAIQKQHIQNGRRESGLSLEQRCRQLNQILSSSIDGVLIIDMKNKIRFINPAGEFLLGAKRNQLLNTFFAHPLHDRTKFEIKQANSRGKVMILEARSVRTSWENQFAFLVTLRNITDEKKQHVRDEKQRLRVKHLAYHDLLTRLPNRQLLDDRLTQALVQGRRENKRFALLFLDLDDFKEINDTCGHHTGDEILRKVARRLTNCVRESDTVGRYGGDEFVIIMNDISESADAAKVSSKIISQIKRPFILGNRQIHLTTSIGIAIFPVDGNTISQLLHHADAAMYLAKKNRKGTYNFYNRTIKLNKQLTERKEFNLRGAYKKHEFIIYYQPQIECGGNLIAGVEALLRWQHPKRGILNPEDFLPKVKNSKFSEKLGLWILSQAVGQCKCWQSQYGFDLRVALSLSDFQWHQKNLPHKMQAILENLDLSPGALNLEIDGRQADFTSHIFRLRLHNLHRTGVNLTYVGFGKDNCSMPYLLELPFDIFKIDTATTAFIRQKTSMRKAFAALIDMVHSFDKTVIASGVESEDDIRMLRALGCDLLQGPGCCEPLPVARISDFIRSTRKKTHFYTKIQKAGFQ